MKKKLSFIVLTLIMVCFFNIKAQAAPSAGITMEGPANIESETEVTLKVSLAPVELDGKNGISEIKIKIPYNKEVLTFVNVEKPSVFLMDNSSSTEGMLDIVLQHITSIEPENQTFFTGGNILTIKFKTKSLTEDKTVTITPENVIAKFTGADQDIESTVLSSTYTLNIAKKKEVVPIEPEKSSNNYLKSLTIVGYGLDKKFNKEATNYAVTVPSDTSDLAIQATAEDSKATVTMTGNKNLKTGTSTATITVTAENGNKKTYQIIITKTPSDNNYLKVLTADGVTFKETFNRYTLKYTAVVEHTQEALNITATAEDAKATVKINNIDELQVGKNTIIITVIAENKEEQKYMIEVTKKEEETLIIPTENSAQLTLKPAKRSATTIPVALGTTGGIMLGAVWGIFILEKRKRI